MNLRLRFKSVKETREFTANVMPSYAYNTWFEKPMIYRNPNGVTTMGATLVVQQPKAIDALKIGGNYILSRL